MFHRVNCDLVLIVIIINVPSSLSEGWCVIFLQVSLSLANLLTSSWFFSASTSCQLSADLYLVYYLSNFNSSVLEFLKNNWEGQQCAAKVMIGEEQ